METRKIIRTKMAGNFKPFKVRHEKRKKKQEKERAKTASTWQRSWIGAPQQEPKGKRGRNEKRAGAFANLPATGLD